MARHGRPPHLDDVDWLREHYPAKTQPQIAHMLGCSQGTVCLALRRHGLTGPPKPKARQDAVSRDVDAQRATDARPGCGQPPRGHSTELVAARVHAVVEANREHRRNRGTTAPLRQSLIDLAAVCQSWASDLPAPAR